MTTIPEYTQETVVADGITAIRRRKNLSSRKACEPYLHIPMVCLEALSKARLPTSAFSLALWVIWHFTVTRGGAASISASFASQAGIADRSARRYAIAALEASGLFEAQQRGKEATRVVPSGQLKALLSKV